MGQNITRMTLNQYRSRHFYRHCLLVFCSTDILWVDQFFRILHNVKSCTIIEKLYKFISTLGRGTYGNLGILFFHSAGYLKSGPPPKASNCCLLFMIVEIVEILELVLVVVGVFVVLNQKVGTTLVVVVVVVAFVLLLFSLARGFRGLTSTCCCCCCKATMFKSCMWGPWRLSLERTPWPPLWVNGWCWFSSVRDGTPLILLVSLPKLFIGSLVR